MDWVVLWGDGLVAQCIQRTNVVLSSTHALMITYSVYFMFLQRFNLGETHFKKYKSPCVSCKYLMFCRQLPDLYRGEMAVAPVVCDEPCLQGVWSISQ